MSIFTEKRKVDTVSMISIIAFSALLTFLITWMIFSKKIENINNKYEIKSMVYEKTINDLSKKCMELQNSLDKVNADIKKVIEGNQ